LIDFRSKPLGFAHAAALLLLLCCNMVLPLQQFRFAELIRLRRTPNA
jgi:hypothetical protein